MSLGGDCWSFKAMRYSYTHESIRRNRILYSFIPSLFRNVAKHSRNYATESSWIKYTVIHFLSSCVMHLSVHWTALCTVPFDRHVDWCAMNRKACRRELLWISRKTIKKSCWDIWGRARESAVMVTRVPAYNLICHGPYTSTVRNCKAALFPPRILVLFCLN